MVDIAAVQAKFDAAFIGGLSGASFEITYQSPLTTYDAVLGKPNANTNAVLPSKAFIPERSRDEVDNESNKVSMLEVIIMRNWLSVEPIVDGIIEVLSGPFAGKWRVDSETESTVVHWELKLIR